MEQARQKISKILNSTIEEAELKHLRFGGVAVPKDLQNLLPMVSLFTRDNKPILVTMAEDEVTAAMFSVDSITSGEATELASVLQLVEHRTAKFMEWWREL